MSVPFNYVDFILTTANTWKTPIEDFTLIVDRSGPDNSSRRTEVARIQNKVLVSFCWTARSSTDPMQFVAQTRAPDSASVIG